MKKDPTQMLSLAERIVTPVIEESEFEFSLSSIPARSNLYGGLYRRNGLRRFLALTETGKKLLGFLCSFAFGAAIISYMIAQWLLYITDFYVKAHR